MIRKPINYELITNNQKGVTQLLLLAVVIGIIVFILIANSFSFKSNLFTSLFLKSASHAAGTTYTPASGVPCGIAGLTFCDNFDEGPAATSGRAGDLNPSKWTGGRVAPLSVGGGAAWNTIIAPVPSCKASLPISGVYPDQDALICDPTGSYSARLMTPVAFQNYGLSSFMIRQPFDFAGRVGKIYFDVDAVSLSAGASWISLDITPDPVPAPNMEQVIEHAQLPSSGLEIHFDNDNCSYQNNGAKNSVKHITVYNDFQETAIPLSTGPNCFGVAQGKLNHIEVDLSQNHVDIYASDTSPDDGKTFPNFQLIASADLNLPFTRGYVHIGNHNHATIKYGYGQDWVYHWDNVGFDGPTVFQDRQYDVPDSLTKPDSSTVNVGYILRDTSGPSGEGTYTCCSNGNLTKIAPFALTNVDLTGATKAQITLDSFYCNGCQANSDYSSFNLRYRFNGGAWQDRFLSPAEANVLSGSGGGVGNIIQVIDVPLSLLHQGTNTLEFSTANTPQNYPPIVGSITLAVFTNASSPSPSLTSSPNPSATAKPGDIDGNSKVDIFDYNILLTNFGKTGTGIQGDLDGNNKVDIFDYNILLSNFGK
jgi:hypothetical protein